MPLFFEAASTRERHPQLQSESEIKRRMVAVRRENKRVDEKNWLREEEQGLDEGFGEADNFSFHAFFLQLFPLLCYNTNFKI